jgi:hypothetical protein
MFCLSLRRLLCFCKYCFLSIFGLINDSIAQQQGTETTRSSWSIAGMTLSPMEPNVSTNSCKGGVPLRFQALCVKCEEMGFKTPSNVFYLKAAFMSIERSTQKKSILGLKSSEWAFLFSAARIHRWSRSTVIG